MIHGGLTIDLKGGQAPRIANCCLRPEKRWQLLDVNENLWEHESLQPLRNINELNQWDKECWTCQSNELSGLTSFRTGMLEKFGRKKYLSGPQRLDLMFDIGCNLACRSCGPYLSTFWQKHLTENNIPFQQVKPPADSDRMIEILKTLDLSNLEMVVFCGGETLMGTGYWKVAEFLINNVQDADKKLTISFQTNGTMPVNKKYHKLIEKCHLIKLHISIDGIGDRFEYLRWPAKWDQLVKNIFNLKDSMPNNTMFLIEETISIFNLFYHNEVDKWVNDNYSTNKLGDVVNHTTHVATGIFNLANITTEYIDNLKNNKLQNLIPATFFENPDSIKSMIKEIKKFDNIRNQDWTKTFPEVASFYSRYL